MADSQNDIVEVIKEIAGDVSITNKQFDTVFKELNIDSLDTFNILLELEEKYGIEIPEEDIENLNTVNSIASYLKTKNR